MPLPTASTTRTDTAGLVPLASPATTATHLGNATAGARESTPGYVMSAGLLPSPPEQSMRTDTVLAPECVSSASSENTEGWCGTAPAPECAGYAELLSQNWDVNEVFTGWLNERVCTHLAPAADILDGITGGTVYTGVVADESCGFQHWSLYGFNKKRSVVWAFAHGMSLPDLVTHHILGWLGALTPEQMRDIDCYMDCHQIGYQEEPVYHHS